MKQAPPYNGQKTRTQTALNAGEDVEQQELPFIAQECKMVQPLRKTVQQFFTKIKRILFFTIH